MQGLENFCADEIARIGGFMPIWFSLSSDISDNPLFRSHRSTSRGQYLARLQEADSARRTSSRTVSGQAHGLTIVEVRSGTGGWLPAFDGEGVQRLRFSLAHATAEV